MILNVAARNLIQARVRTGMLSLAIGMVTMALILLMSLSAGINDNLVRGATTMSGGMITVGGFYKQTPTSAAPLVTHIDEVRKVVQENTPNLDYMIDRSRGWGKLISTTGSAQSGLSGIDVAEESHFFDVITLAKESEYKVGGRDEAFGNPRDLAKPDTIMLFVSQAKRLDVTVGDLVTVQIETMGGQTNTVDVTVVAVAKDLGLLSSFAVYLPKSTLRELYKVDDGVGGAVWVYLKEVDESEATMKHLREVFAAKGYRVMDHVESPFFMKFETVQGEDWTGQKIDLTIWRDEVAMLTWVITAFDTVTGALVAVLVVIIAVGIMNSMWNTVRERTREVGTMRAIGMQRGQVALLFLAEAFLLGLFATSMGALFGIALALGIDALHITIPVDAVKFVLLADTLHFKVRPLSVFFAISTLTTVTALSAVWPSIRAAGLRPVIALGYAQ